MNAKLEVSYVHQTFQVPKMEKPHVYKLYGYGLCKGFLGYVPPGGLLKFSPPNLPAR